MKLTKCSAVRSSGQGAVDTFRERREGRIGEQLCDVRFDGEDAEILAFRAVKEFAQKIRRDLAAKQAGDRVQRPAVQVEGKPCKGDGQ